MVKSILKESGSNQNIIICGNISINMSEHKVLMDNQEVELTAKEFKLLYTLCKKTETLFTREQLLNTLAPSNLDSSDRIIDNHISSLRKKLKDSDIEIKTIYSQGYKAILK